MTRRKPPRPKTPRYWSDRTDRAPESKHTPGRGCASLLVPGLGQALAGQYAAAFGWGLAWLVACGASVALDLPLGLLVNLLAAYDAYRP